MKKGITLISDTEGTGPEIKRNNYYQLSMKMWLNHGDSIKWEKEYGLLDRSILSEDKTELIADYRIDREYLIPGILYGIEGMRIGGIRKFKIKPHLAYGENGVQNMIPPNAMLIIEVKIIEERNELNSLTNGSN